MINRNSTLKSVLALILCTVMLVMLTIGCANTANNGGVQDTENGSELPLDENGIAPDENAGPSEIDFNAAFASFPPDTVMMRAGGLDLTWEEFFIFLHMNISYMLSVSNEPIDWTELLPGDISYAEWLLQSAVDEALSFKAIEFGVLLNDVSLSQQDRDDLRENIMDSVLAHGGMEEFLEMLWVENGFSNMELFEQWLIVYEQRIALIFELFGDDLDSLTDEDLEELTADDGYLMAKHILHLFSEDGGDDALISSEEIHSLLTSYTGDDFDAYFDELMFAHSEDTGLDSSPNGYLFQIGDMVQPFYDAAEALEIGGLSAIVESNFGYHIIYRIPINYDVTPSAYRQSTNRSLRQIMALVQFNAIEESWSDMLIPEFSEEFESIDIAEIFKFIPLQSDS